MSSYKKILILGSGGLRIGQAGEFDYSGSQAIKALKEEGIQTVLINPNIATVQTDGDMADRVYFQPLQLDIVKKIIKKERPDGVIVSFGGQTALNLGLQLEGVKILGTPVKTIKITEDRDLFKKELEKIGVKTPRSIAVYSMEEAIAAARQIGYPIMIRSGYSLGGLGSGRVNSETELKSRVLEKQMLIEEYLAGWKEIEYEVVRDRDGNTITVCNMENLDPMGIHTGESIVVAPSQTLNNSEYHLLREIAIKTIKHLGIVGECNIQYALRPSTSSGQLPEYRVIEVNARLSRSSALASKATGYPLAYVAAKLALGYRLHELKNSVTKSTSAFFEPALDYLAVKMPRWDLQKMKISPHLPAGRQVGSEMKSVGEVMALGRSFPEALQKAIRMLNIPTPIIDHPSSIIQHPTDQRLFALLEAFRKGMGVKKAHQLSQITPWFLEHIKAIATFKIKKNNLREAKQMGFSDKDIAVKLKTTEENIRQRRVRLGIMPVIKQIDTLAGEFDAQTNYLYTTYHGTTHDVEPLKKPVIVLGSGPYCIGSSVEFDWCAVNAVKALRAHGRTTVVINSNPETVSTDFDISDRLYFEELTLERISDIADFENRPDIVVSVGGQIANNVALPLAKAGYRLLGTSADSIDKAEDRQKFSAMLNKLGIDQPEWTKATTFAKARAFARRVGYPVIVRPSYVLSGAFMKVIESERDLSFELADHPVVISKFLTNAKEFEIDAVAHQGEIVIYAISEHIENAGVHSGDATVVLPPQRLYLETVRRAKRVAKRIAMELKITGPFNIQFIAKDNDIKVIECNVRASRSFPFVSKVINRNFVAIATEAILGIKHDVHFRTLDLDYVGVKSPQFSYHRLKGADPVAGVEMASTGEVACLGADLLEAFYLSWLSTEQSVNGKRILVSIADEAKKKLLPSIKKLYAVGYMLYATAGTHGFLKSHDVFSKLFHRLGEREPTIETAIKNRAVDLAINIPSPGIGSGDASKIRRLAIDNHISLVTNANTAALLLRCLVEVDLKKLDPKSWQEFVGS